VRVSVLLASGLLVAVGGVPPVSAQDWELAGSRPIAASRPTVDPAIVGRWRGRGKYAGLFRFHSLGDIEYEIWSVGIARIREGGWTSAGTVYSIRASDRHWTLESLDGTQRSGTYSIANGDHVSMLEGQHRLVRMDRVKDHEPTASVESRGTRAVPIDDWSNIATVVALASDQAREDRDLGLFRLAVLAVEKPEAALSAVPVFMAALTDSSPRVATLAADALANLGPSASAAVNALVQALRSESPDVRERSARALGRIAAEPDLTATALTVMISDPDEGTRSAVIEALGNFGGRGVGVIATALADESEEVSRRAIESLKKLGPEAAAAVPALISALREGHSSRPPPKSLFDALTSVGDGYLRRGAAEALARIGPAARPAVPSLIEALESRPTVATTAAAALSAFPEDAAISVPAIAKVLDRWPVYMSQWRKRIVDSLGAFGAAAAVAVPALTKVIQDEAETPRVREAAEQAREKILRK
jgi:HEAT repeat protein